MAKGSKTNDKGNEKREWSWDLRLVNCGRGRIQDLDIQSENASRRE